MNERKCRWKKKHEKHQLDLRQHFRIIPALISAKKSDTLDTSNDTTALTGSQHSPQPIPASRQKCRAPKSSRCDSHLDVVQTAFGLRWFYQRALQCKETSVIIKHLVSSDLNTKLSHIFLSQLLREQTKLHLISMILNFFLLQRPVSRFVIFIRSKYIRWWRMECTKWLETMQHFLNSDNFFHNMMMPHVDKAERNEKRSTDGGAIASRNSYVLLIKTAHKNFKIHKGNFWCSLLLCVNWLNISDVDISCEVSSHISGSFLPFCALASGEFRFNASAGLNVHLASIDLTDNFWHCVNW